MPSTPIFIRSNLFCFFDDTPGNPCSHAAIFNQEDFRSVLEHIGDRFDGAIFKVYVLGELDTASVEEIKDEVTMLAKNHKFEVIFEEHESGLVYPYVQQGGLPLSAGGAAVPLSSGAAVQHDGVPLFVGAVQQGGDPLSDGVAVQQGGDPLSNGAAVQHGVLWDFWRRVPPILKSSLQGVQQSALQGALQGVRQWVQQGSEELVRRGGELCFEHLMQLGVHAVITASSVLFLGIVLWIIFS